MSKPTHEQIKAVHKVLYDHKQLQAMAEDVQQINLSMNFIGPPLPNGDIRVSVGDGPNWVTQATGQVDPLVLEAAGRCDRIVKRLETMRHELSQLSLPSGDKQHLTTAVKEQALAWSTRAGLWRDQTAPDDVNAAIEPITKHEQAAVTALTHVQPYLRPVSDFKF